MELVDDIPDDVSAQNVSECLICKENVEPSISNTSVCCSKCGVVYHAKCVNKWLDTNVEPGEYDTEKCCHCQSLHPFIRYRTQSRHFTIVFFNLESRLVEKAFRDNESALQNLIQKLEACRNQEDKQFVLEEQTQLQRSICTTITGSFKELYPQSIVPLMRKRGDIANFVENYIGKMENDLKDTILAKIRRSVRKLRTTRIDAMIKQRGPELRLEFLASPTYAYIVRVEAENFKDSFAEFDIRPASQELRRVEEFLVNSMNMFVERVVCRRILAELHAQVQVHSFDDTCVEDTIHKYVFFFNYQENRDEQSIMWSQFKRDVGDLVLAYRLDRRM